MVEFNIIINDSASDGYRKKASQIDSKLKGLSTRVVNVIHRWVQKEAPRKTGKLKSTIQKTSSAAGGSIFMGKGAPYFLYVLDGTRPHIIHFKNKGGLWWKGANHPMNHVHHPGTKANPYIDRGFEKSEAGIRTEVQKFVDWLES